MAWLGDEVGDAAVGAGVGTNGDDMLEEENAGSEGDAVRTKEGDEGDGSDEARIEFEGDSLGEPTGLSRRRCGDGEDVGELVGDSEVRGEMY